MRYAIVRLLVGALLVALAACGGDARDRSEKTTRGDGLGVDDVALPSPTPTPTTAP